MASLERSDVLILDVRDTDEYHGSSTVPETVPFPPTKRQGHIPGATHLEINYVNNHDILEDAEWTFRPAGELFSMFQEAGVTPDKEIITYCEHGTRSSQTVFALRLLGYENARLYDGGWMDWGNREDLPIEI